MKAADSESIEYPGAPLRAAILGCGWFGGVHLERLSAIPGVHVVALADPDTAAAVKLAEGAPMQTRPAGARAATYADYRELLQREDLDFVCIASPNQLHVEQILASLGHGFNVLCEKPLSMEPDGVQAVIDLTAESGKLVAIAYQSRYRRSARILREIVSACRYGKITSVHIHTQEDWVTPNVSTWRHDPARCPGGFFADANGHQFDFLFHVTGLEAEWVRAETETRGTPVPIVTWGDARLRSHDERRDVSVPMGFMCVGDAHSWREEIAITMERADFVVRNGQLLWSSGGQPISEYPASLAPAEVLDLPDQPDSAFVSALRGGPPVVSAPEAVWPVLRFTLAALASAEACGEKTVAVDRWNASASGLRSETGAK